MDRDFEYWYDTLHEDVGVSEEALNLAFAVGGRNIETAQRILSYFTGWHSFEGFMSELNDEN